MTHPALIERITRSLAYMLRHQPDQFDLELDRFGYADVTEVVQALNERLDEPIEEEDIEDAVEAGASTRYEIKNGRIGALYGHSIEVEPGEPSKPPEFLYVGLPVRDAERALKTGLRGGRRSFLHLALSQDAAAETGRRLARSYTLVEVHALDAWEEGINFYDRKSLYLSETIPTTYLELGETYDDGEGPPQRRTERGGRGPRGRSGGGGGRGRRPERNEQRDEEPRQSRDSGGRGRGRSRDEAPREERSREPRREERAPRRDERPARESKPREQEVAKRDVPRPAKKQETVTDSFGVGVYEAKPKAERKPAKPKPAPRQEAPKAPEPAKPAQPKGPSFGEGV